MSNSFGTLFCVTTWGESHGPAIGCVIDGCPAGLPLTAHEIQVKLDQRAPGKNSYVSPRKEPDCAEILSGVFEGVTTGAPISILIRNQDSQSDAYKGMQDLLRPGHANFTYLQKYGIFDFRGGGRASARETACRVAAGAIAEKILATIGVSVIAFLKGCGSYVTDETVEPHTELTDLFCLNLEDEKHVCQIIEEAKKEEDSIGGVVECVAFGVPAGLGDPIYEKMEAKLSSAMMSIPASKGFEIGSGYAASRMKGSEHNDLFVQQDKKITCSSNHAGGILAGITTGMPITMRIHFKPTSTIPRPQATINLQGHSEQLLLPPNSRHDPAIVLRAIPVCKAMCALVLVDSWLLHRSNKL